MSAKPIGVYDSGIGGLTVLRALQQELPHENLVYFADTAHLPYGNKTPQQIKAYAKNILTWMRDEADVKMVVAACHTSSAIALPTLTSEFSIPIIGAIEPLRNTITKDDKIGIIATPATAASLMHEQILRTHGFTGAIVTISCPDFAPLIEAGFAAGQLDLDLLQKRAEEYVQPFHIHQLNTLIYGCTHYPLINSIIQPLLPSVRCINPAQAIAKQAAHDLQKHHLLNASRLTPFVRFECNTDKEVFQRKVDMVQLSF